MQDGRPNRVQISTLIALIAIGAFAFGFQTGRGNGTAAFSSEAPGAIENPQAEMPEGVDFTEFWRAWNILDSKYVAPGKDEVSDQEKVWGAIQGLAASLGDPYTVFLPPEDLEMFESDISGNFTGVGMEIGIKDGVLTVVAPLKDTPAYRAGIQPGDKVIQIDGEVTANLSVDQAVRKIRGEEGTEIRLTIIREGKSEPIEVVLKRAVIQIPTIDTEFKKTASGSSGSNSGSGLRDDGAFVIKLYNFSAPSASLFRQALRDFIESGSDTLILDLRGNPGGYLEASVDMASWFLPRGKVIVTEDFGEDGEEQRIHRSRGYDVFNKNLKMAILVNGGSASASEILAGALSEHDVAILVGEKTFGKGSVQELIPVTAESSLKITIARWLTPDGNSISENGLMPDIEVKQREEDTKKGIDTQLERAIEELKKK